MFATITKIQIAQRCAFALLVVGLFSSVPMLSQVEESRPRFSDYPAQPIYHGKPALPVLKKNQRMFRTMIRLGAKSPVEFAGHYTVPVWGCGAGCNQFAVVDSISGRVYDVPFVVSEFPFTWEAARGDQIPERMEFHANSRLLKINGCPNERDCGFYDYLMAENGLKLLRKELLPKEFQP